MFRHKIHLHDTQKEKGTDRLKRSEENEGELKVNDVSHLIDIVQRRSFVRPVAFTLFFSILHQSCHHNYYSTSILPHHLSHAKSQRKYKTNFISEHIAFILLKVFMHGILFHKQFQRQIYKFIHTYIIQKTNKSETGYKNFSLIVFYLPEISNSMWQRSLSCNICRQTWIVINLMRKRTNININIRHLHVESSHLQIQVYFINNSLLLQHT